MIVYLTLLLYEIVSATGTDYDLSLREDATINDIFYDLSGICSKYELKDLDECCKINDSGYLQVAKELDRETTSSYFGSLDCTLDVNPYFITHQITVNIVDKNDNSPVFSQPAQSLNVNEKTSVPVEYPLVGATDRDTEPNSVSGYELTTDTDKFEIVTGTWSGGTLPLSLKIIKELDYDTGDKSFVLNIRAYDKDDKSDTLVLTITVNDINDHKPEFESSSYTDSVAEDAGTQTVVLTVVATDADSGDNGKVLYSLLGDNLPFAVRDNGDIIVTRALDRETVSSYTFQVEAQDSGTVSRKSSVSVVVAVLDVNDNQPVILSPTNGETVELRENLPIGSIVCKVQISDKDSGDNSKISVTIEGGYSDRFEYAVKQGDIGQIVTKAVLNREETDSYTLIIKAEDSGTPVRSREVQFILRVLDDNDNEPSIINCDQSFTVAENFVGKLFNIEANDEDIGRNAELIYSIVDTARYSVDEDGAVNVKKEFDYEVTKSTTVEVTVTDNSTSNPLSTVCNYNLIVSDVNDNPPVLQDLGLVTVKEDVGIGSEITTLVATDVDTSDEDKMTFSLLTDSDVFSVDSVAGVVRNKVLLDRETEDHYMIEVAVYDSDHLHNDTIQIQIQVLDVSDTKPVFLSTPYIVDLSELAPVDQVVAKVEAMDADLDDTITFAISSPYFVIDSETGEISISNTLKGVSSSQLTSEVRASDGRYVTTTDLVVNVYKDDGQAPLVSQNGEKLSETAEVGSTAGKCTGSSSSPIRYQLSWDAENENYKSVFVIDGESGVITTTSQLDYEQHASYSLTCSVTNIHDQSTDATVTVKVEGVNEFAPEFTKSIFSFDAYDPVEQDKVIGKVEATDADKGNDGILQYILLGDQPGWRIKRSTGEIMRVKQQNEDSRRKRSLDEDASSKRSVDESGSVFHTVRLEVEVRDSPSEEEEHLSARAAVDISVYPYTGGNDQVVIIGAAAGGGLLLIILILVCIFIVMRRRKAKSGSKDLTYVNPTAYTDKDGRNITGDGGYHSSDIEKKEIDIVLQEMSGFSEIKRNVTTKHTPYSVDELGGEFRDTPLFEMGDSSYHTSSNPGYLNVRDKTVPHKMSVSTVLSDMRNDVQVSAIPHRLTGSLARTGSCESVHVFGSEGGGEGDAVIDAHNLFNKLADIDDDVSVIDKSNHFLGDQDSAFSSLGSGSSNGDQVTTPYHTEYLQDWKPAFQSVGKICEGMLRNDKQFAYKSNSGDISVENVYSNQNTLSTPRDNHSPARDSEPANHSPVDDRIYENQSPASDALYQNAIEVTPTQLAGSVVSSYRGSREDVISGHSRSPGRSESSC